MKKRIFKILLVIFILLIVYLCFVCLPYARHLPAGDDLQASFDAAAFYQDSPGTERAAILSDNGDALARRIQMISHARERVVLSTFDFKADNSGKIMLAALADAAQRGVQVNILIDGFPYFVHAMGNPFFYAVASMENVTLKVYNTVNVLQPHRLMARMHDKYLIVDDTAYILGGRNTYDYFLGEDTDYVNYDWDVLVYTPESSSSLTQLDRYFSSVWEHSACKIKMDRVPFFLKQKVSDSKEELTQLYAVQKELHPQWFAEISYEDITVETNRISLLSNPIQPAVKEPVLFYEMTELMKHADSAVYFHTPYILCSDDMMQRLDEVCASAPSVTMMTNSVANNGNPFGAVDYQLYKPEILDTGVQILEYDSGVSYHGKCFTVDGRLCGIGSFNWDMRSAYIDTELMLVIDSEPLTALLRDEMKLYEQECLIVKNAEEYALSEAQTPQPISKKHNLRITFLKPFDRWLRFLM